MYRRSEESQRPGVYQIITDRIMEMIDRGVAPWRQPWTGTLPTNYDSGKPYKGINIFTLTVFGTQFKSPYFLTYRQAQKHGGHVQAGQHGFPVVWKERKVKEEENSRGEKVQAVRWYLKYYTVFNLEQTEGVPFKEAMPKSVKTGDEAVRACETVLAGMPRRPFEVLGSRAAYNPRLDQVIMPPTEAFHTAGGYVSTRFHEYTHATAHPDRCARARPWPPDIEFGNAPYSFEELVAQMGAAYLCAQLGIDNSGFEDVLDQSASYIKGWLKPLKNDKTFLMRASGKARQAAEFILEGKVPARTDAGQVNTPAAGRAPA